MILILYDQPCTRPQSWCRIPTSTTPVSTKNVVEAQWRAVNISCDLENNSLKSVSTYTLSQSMLGNSVHLHPNRLHSSLLEGSLFPCDPRVHGKVPEVLARARFKGSSVAAGCGVVVWRWSSGCDSFLRGIRLMLTVALGAVRHITATEAQFLRNEIKIFTAIIYSEVRQSISLINDLWESVS